MEGAHPLNALGPARHPVEAVTPTGRPARPSIVTRRKVPGPYGGGFADGPLNWHRQLVETIALPRTVAAAWCGPAPRRGARPTPKALDTHVTPAKAGA